MYHNFLIHSSANGHLGCFLVIVNSAAMKLGYMCLFRFWFPLYAQQWDCWVVWQLYFQFFKESPHRSP